MWKAGKYIIKKILMCYNQQETSERNLIKTKEWERASRMISKGDNMYDEIF